MCRQATSRVAADGDADAGVVVAYDARGGK
jgi:hypothetical protein